MTNNYSVEQYELVREMALELKEMEIRGDFPVDDFLDALRAWTLATSKNRLKAEEVDPGKTELLRHFEARLGTILEMTETHTLNFLTNVIADLKIMTKEDLDEF